MSIFNTFKTEYVTNGGGNFTDVWLDGKYSRLPGHLRPSDARNEIMGVREIMKRKDR